MDTQKKEVFDDFVEKTISVFNMQEKLVGNTFFFPEISGFDCVSWKDDRERDIAILAVRALCRAYKLSYFMFSSEAWISTFSQEEADVVKAGGGNLPRPSNDPNRKEVCICTFVSKEETYASYAPIVEVMGKRMLGEWEFFGSSVGETTSAWQVCFGGEK
jgi:hypothetical protein